MSRATADTARLLDFWFGPVGSAEYGRPCSEWFRKNPAFDRSIVEQFGALIEQALRGELADWAEEPQPALAQILLLDQFTRNAFRNTARAFAGDALALAAAQAMVASQQDCALIPVQRAFVYLPYEHAEDLALQDEAVRLFSRLVAVDPELQSMLDYAERHRAVIRRFGRFPHRNAALGRRSTGDEVDFLSQPGAGF